MVMKCLIVCCAHSHAQYNDVAALVTNADYLLCVCAHTQCVYVNAMHARLCATESGGDFILYIFGSVSSRNGFFYSIVASLVV